MLNSNSKRLTGIGMSWLWQEVREVGAKVSPSKSPEVSLAPPTRPLREDRKSENLTFFEQGRATGSAAGDGQRACHQSSTRTYKETRKEPRSIRTILSRTGFSATYGVDLFLPPSTVAAGDV